MYGVTQETAASIHTSQLTKEKLEFSSGNFKNVKLSYWKTVGSEPLKSTTIHDLIAQTCAKYGQRDALVSVHQGQSVTFEQVQRKTTQLACGLLSIGLRKGDHVGLVGPNTVEWYISLLGAISAGLVVVNINPLLEVPEMKYCLNQVDVKALITDEAYNDKCYYNVLESIIPELKQQKCTEPLSIKNSSVPTLTHLIIMSEKHYPGAYRLKDLFISGEDNKTNLQRIQSSINEQDECNIQFTSGTTGSPKGAVLSHHSIVNNSYFFGKRLLLSEKHHKICFQVPLFHTFGTVLGVLAAMHHGTTIVMPSQKFSPRNSIHAIIREKCTFVYGTPTMYIDLITVLTEMSRSDKSIFAKLSSLEGALTAGSVCPPELFNKLRRFFNFKRIYSGYGMTEASPITFLSLPTDSEFHVTCTVGYVADHAEVKVVDEKGDIVPVGTPGEVMFKGYMVMKSYYNDPDATAKAIEDGWLHSGDRFVLLENGYGQVIGRIKDTIIRGGENIEPSEIENVLLTHPEINNVQAFAVYDERLGEVVAASIIKNENSNLSQDDVRQHCKGKIASYKIPVYINFVSSFPQTASGKIQKYKLREMMEKELGYRNL